MVSYAIGRFSFMSQKAAFDEVKRILHSVELDTPLRGYEHRLIRALLDRHHEADMKLAKGCKHIVAREREHPYQPGVQRCFHIVHDDGTSTTFSAVRPDVYKANYDEQKRKRNDIKKACVEYMARYMRFYMEDNFRGICELTGDHIDRGQANVDHSGEWPMSRILDAFIDETKFDWARVVRTQYGPRLTDEDGLRFKAFHDERAVLKIVARRVNVRKGNRGEAALTKELSERPVQPSQLSLFK